MNYEELRAIVSDLADCDPSEPELNDCVLCNGTYEAGHTERCPWKRARKAIN